MGNFPLTRIALNLSLIVALSIQPVAVDAVTADCSRRCRVSDALTCQGCRCCQVKEVTDRCGCCSSTAQSADPNAGKPSCCSQSEPADQILFVARCGDLDDSDPAYDGSDPDELKATRRSLCLCGKDSQPWSDSSSSSSATELRASLAIGFASSRAADCDSRVSLSIARAEMVPALAHFSQIVLCIWRL